MINIHTISLAYFLIAVLSTPVYAAPSDQGQASVVQDPAVQEPVVTISSGAISGRVDDGVYAFKGIPYAQADRKSTRLNSSHVAISYAVFCLKKKKRSLTTNTHPLATQ